jgi:hypothetical protein
MGSSMNFIFHPWQFFFLILSGLVNRRQQEIIEFQNAQIRTLMDKMGRRRLLLTDDQRRVLAAKGKAIGRRALMELTTIVTPSNPDRQAPRTARSEKRFPWRQPKP